MHASTSGRAQAILSHALTLLLQIRERGITAHTVHRPVGHSQMALARSASREREPTRNVKHRITLTTMLSQPAPLRMGLSMEPTVSCCKDSGIKERIHGTLNLITLLKLDLDVMASKKPQIVFRNDSEARSLICHSLPFTFSWCLRSRTLA
ncbi:uncharacterized protein HD556DRAFT_380307 [Suillus plorans]|uniref:Uncharacterized protein n=1 Tax=Suillus plorans TaxID=116603 RepID=A0A9P7DJC2_9AGAM|nr:uncharacterized protein HD556DRAFT_380307 [Suillus plorans]KAG1795334.1 hypothetical protein HD556DRAFT_380307 [Suillus plorans]